MNDLEEDKNQDSNENDEDLEESDVAPDENGELIEESEDEEVDDFEDEETTREIVVPGEVLSEDVKNYIPGRGTILNQDRTKIVSLHIGLKQIKKNYINVIPLRGLYTPKPGDKVVAIVTDKNPVKYLCDINSKDDAQLKPKNTIKKARMPRMGRGRQQQQHYQEEENTSKFEIGEILIAKVVSANRLNKPELTTIGKYLGQKNNGIVISIDPPKIPRVIGRNGSMIKMLKRLTNCNIFVTQNGRIWLKGEDYKHERLLMDAVHKIEREAHTVGLTDRIEVYLKNEKEKRGLK